MEQGLLSQATGRPQPIQAAPEVEDQDNAIGTEQVTPEEQQAYEQGVAAVIAELEDPDVAESIGGMLSQGSAAIGLAQAAVSITVMLDKKYDFPEAVIVHVADAAAGEIAKMAEEAGREPFTDDEYTKASTEMIRMLMEEYGADESDAHALMAQFDNDDDAAFGLAAVGSIYRDGQVS